MLAPAVQEIITYEGLIDSLNVVEIVNDIESKAEALGISSSLQKKIFNISVESLQNLYHHTRDFSVPGKDDEEVRKVLFQFCTTDEYFLLKSSNLLREDQLRVVEEKINFVNGLSKDELKDLYKKVLTNNQISDKGGAGLGFIDMRRKSGEALEYQAEKLGDQLARFTFTVKINKNKEKE